jgi:NADH-ubiquinone oxidoreductase chain 4
LAILYILTIVGGTDLDLLFKSNLNYNIQLILFVGIFIAFAVKTPVIFLNT